MADTLIPGPGLAEAASASLPSFEDFHHATAARALRYASGVVGADRAEDACQEAWLRAWRAWGSASPDHLQPWLFRIVRNCCTDRLRAQGRQGVYLQEVDLDAVPPAEETVLADPQMSPAILVLRRLSPPLREALWLREVRELSYREIAGIQRVPVGTVMSRLHRARKQAAELLAS